MDYLLKAADQAWARFAYPEATRHCTDAIAILQHSSRDPAASLQAFESLGDLQSLQGYIELANQAYDRALECAETGPDRQRVANKLHHPGTVTRNGSTIAYYTHGSTGPPVVLMHPAAYGIGAFQPLLELLCQEFRIITIDPRGLGASAPLPEVYRVRDHVEDIRTVIETVVQQPVILVGYSNLQRLRCSALSSIRTSAPSSLSVVPGHRGLLRHQARPSPHGVKSSRRVYALGTTNAPCTYL